MKLSFLDRDEEAARLRRFLARRESALAVLYGRRRCGKTRLVQEALRVVDPIYYVADDRESSLQRASFAREIARRVPGFDAATYPDWDAVLSQAWDRLPPGTVLVLDEFPALVSQAREVPSLLQKRIDPAPDGGPKVILAGSSQRMMHGLVLDRVAPLYGRAAEVMRISPLPAGWIKHALNLADDVKAVDAFATWGGVPRYWELAADFPTRDAAVKSLVLSPLGVLREEPSTLLLDDLREAAQAASILSLIGQGCHRLSEIAGRLGKPATSLARPMQRLVDLEMVGRDIPFGSSPKGTKRTIYRIADPFLRFWFRFLDPNRSRLDAGQVDAVAREIAETFSMHVTGVWEDMVRESVARAAYGGRRWKPARRWWGKGLDGEPMEIDVIAEGEDGQSLLVGEAKWVGSARADRLVAALRAKAANLPLPRGHKTCLAIWMKEERRGPPAGVKIFSARHVLEALR